MKKNTEQLRLIDVDTLPSLDLRILNVRLQVHSKYLNVYRINAQSGRAVKTVGEGAGRVEVIFVVTGQNKFRTFLKSWQ